MKPGCMPAGQTGYLSMDQARSLLPLEATDANVSVLADPAHTYLTPSSVPWHVMLRRPLISVHVPAWAPTGSTVWLPFSV